MFKIYPAGRRFTRNRGWLYTSLSFSFAEYFDPDNMEFGPLRVFNDDIVKPQNGFGFHGHQEMEIVSIVTKGELLHEDSMGNQSVLRAGEIQRMSAGTGIMHSETNPSSTEDVHFFQLWFEPAQEGLTPSYEQIAYDQEAMKNELLPVVSGRLPAQNHVANIHQDVTIYMSSLEPGHLITFTQKPDRKIYVFVIEGELTANSEHKLSRRDSARITDVSELALTTETGATWMLIDLP